MEYKDKLKYIEEILCPILLPLEFSFDYYDMGQDGYSFQFDRNNQLLDIYDKFRYINMRFIIKKPKRRVVNARLLAEVNYLILDSPRLVEYDYKSEEDFRNIILTFKEIILNKGLKKLEEMSKISTVPVRNTKYFEYLKCHRNEVVREYMAKRRNISPEHELSNIELKVSVLRDRLFEDALCKLIDASAIYGDWIIRNFGGEWQEFDGIYGIRSVGKNNDVVIPTDDIFKLWEKFESVSYKAYCEKYR